MKKRYIVPGLILALSLTLLSFVNPGISKSAPVTDSLVSYEAPATASKSMLSSLYESLDLSGFGLSKEAFDYAVKGYQKLVDNGEVEKNKYLTVIDFSQSSRKKRFYLIDVENQELVVNTFVSHGKNSGVDMAKSFSDRINSNQSSLGFYVTKGTYTGKHGLSLRLSGKERGFNANAEPRAIVVHGADYVNAGRVNSGFMGRSQGCPALPMKDYAKVINLIKDGSVMFIYHPSQNYIQQSQLING